MSDAVEQIEQTKCLVEVPDRDYLGRPSISSRLCNRPGVAVCEDHLEAERGQTKHVLDKLRTENEQLKMMLAELVHRVESEATAKMRMVAAIDAAKGMLSWPKRRQRRHHSSAER